MKDKETIQDYFCKLSTLVKEIRGYAKDIFKRNVLEKILRVLPPKYNYIMVAIEESKDISTYSQNLGSLMAHEGRMKKGLEKSLGEAFKTKA